MRILILSLFIIPFIAPGQSADKQLKSLQVIKFDNYDDVEGEQTVFEKSWEYDSTGKYKPQKFDMKWAYEKFRFPHQLPVFYQSDTLNSKAVKTIKTPIAADTVTGKNGEVLAVSEYAPVYDEKGRIKKYNAGKNVHYLFEYTSSGNLWYIKRYGAKHITAQVTFIYQFHPVSKK